MALPDGTEPIADDEILYRRIPACWCTEQQLSPRAFHPHPERDVDGISLWRDKYKSIEEAAHGWPGRDYYVGVLRAGDLRMWGIEVVPTVEKGGVGHVSAPTLNAANRRDQRTQDLEHVLAGKLTLRIEGPFHTPGGENR